MLAWNDLTMIKLQTAEKRLMMEMLTELCLLREVVHHISPQGLTVQLYISEKQDIQ